MNVKCPNCHAINSIEVEYGELTDNMIKRIENGEILHGGCAIKGLMPHYYCFSCDTRFDQQCSDEFINHICLIEVNAYPLQLNDEMKSWIKESQIEYLKESHDQSENIVLHFEDYFISSLSVDLNHPHLKKLKEQLKK